MWSVTKNWKEITGFPMELKLFNVTFLTVMTYIEIGNNRSFRHSSSKHSIAAFNIVLSDVVPLVVVIIRLRGTLSTAK